MLHTLKSCSTDQSHVPGIKIIARINSVPGTVLFSLMYKTSANACKFEIYQTRKDEDKSWEKIINIPGKLKGHEKTGNGTQT